MRCAAWWLAGNCGKWTDGWRDSAGVDVRERVSGDFKVMERER